MHLEMGQGSLAESLLSQTLGHNRQLERIDELVDWTRFVRFVSGLNSARKGRPSYPPLVMVKVVLSQHWYNLFER